MCFHCLQLPFKWKLWQKATYEESKHNPPQPCSFVTPSAVSLCHITAVSCKSPTTSAVLVVLLTVKHNYQISKVSGNETGCDKEETLSTGDCELDWIQQLLLLNKLFKSMAVYIFASHSMWGIHFDTLTCIKSAFFRMWRALAILSQTWTDECKF